ncbi:recombinase family protein [Rhodoblastus sp.]|uniref:recombinase family protein n=1 Tax=Rhodoblastus sp. TaxID=1962975 RepID=UPI003F9660BC
MCQNYVGYYRVSTEKQGGSGLGLDAQQTAVEAFIASRGADGKLVASFVEVESGKRSDNRPELTRAMEHARLTGSTLLIAKLDRLSRDAHFLLGLQKAGVRFVAADMPEANELVVGIMAVIAQAERKMISTRTKAALAEARKRVAVTGQQDTRRSSASAVRPAQRIYRGRASTNSPYRLSKPKQTNGRRVWHRRSTPCGPRASRPPTAWLARSTLGVMRRPEGAGGRPGPFSMSRLGCPENAGSPMSIRSFCTCMPRSLRRSGP